MIGIMIERFSCRLLSYCRVKQHILVARFSSSSSSVVEGTYVDPLESEDVDEDELDKKRNKHRLPDRIYRVYVQKESEQPSLKHHFDKKSLRKFYGRHGAASGLNPGLMWPSKEELQDLVDHDKMFYPTLKEMEDKIEAERAEEERERREYEEEVDRNMAKLDQWTKEYYDKIEKKRKEVEEAHKKRQLLIEEISEYLGYDVDPKDPRFQEAVEQREREKKRAKRKQKQEEEYSKMVKRLTEMTVSETEEKAEDEK